MGLELAKAFVSVRGEVSQFANDIRSAQGQIMGAVNSLSGRIRSALALAGIGYGFYELFHTLKESAGMAREEIDIHTRLAAMINLTGAKAGFTAEQLEKFADELQNVIAVDEDEILKAAGSLMMFGSVSGDVFKDVLKAAADLSAAGFGSLTSNVTRLGRAMERPTQGARMLRSMMIVLTAEQQENIKVLEKAGKKMEAQAMLMDIIKKKAPGMAAAMSKTPAGRMRMMDVDIGNLKEDLGMFYIPFFESLKRMQVGFYQFLKTLAPYANATFSLLSDLFSSIADFFMGVWETATGNVGEQFGWLSKPMKEFASSFLSYVDVLFGSWEGFRMGLVHGFELACVEMKIIWNDLSAGIMTIWVKLLAWMEKKWKEIGPGGYNMAPVTTAIAEALMLHPLVVAKRGLGLSKISTKQAVQTLVEDVVNAEKERRHKTKDLGGPEVGKIEANRKKAEEKFNDSILDLWEQWDEDTDNLPLLSDRFKEALEKVTKAAENLIHQQKLPVFAPPVVAGEGTLKKKKETGAPSGFMGAADFGRRLQEYLLKDDGQLEQLRGINNNTANIANKQDEVIEAIEDIDVGGGLP